jgi:acetyl/propionyl-CoA carboxylase alpha subunit
MQTYKAIIAENEYKIVQDADSAYLLDGRRIVIGFKKWKNISRIVYQNQHYNIFINRIDETHWEVWIKHFILHVILEDQRSGLLSKFKESIIREHNRFEITAPMPGMIIGLDVQVGQMVSVGDRIGILEAMKMENEIRSLGSGTVQSIRVKKGAIVEKGEILLVITI